MSLMFFLCFHTDSSHDGHSPTPGAQNSPEVRTLPPNSRYHTSSESSYPPDFHKPSRHKDAAQGRDRDRMEYQGRHFNPHHHHTWNNNHSHTIPIQHYPENSGGNNKKSRGRKVNKSESESGISKLLKTLRKDSSGKRAAAAAAAKERERELSASSSTLDPRYSRPRRGSLDRSPTRKHNASPDRRRAKSMDRRAERAHRDCTPEREYDDGGFLSHAATPERPLFDRRLLREPQTPGRAYMEATTPERPNNGASSLSRSRGRTTDMKATTPERPNNGASSLSLSRGRTPDRGSLKNGNLLRDSSAETRDESYGINGTPERLYRSERDSSPNSSSSREELNYAAAPAPRLKNYYSTLKNNSSAHHNTGYNNAGLSNKAGQHHNNAVGRAPNQFPEPKRRFYKESPKDLSI